jgi:hypothetical protein
MKTLNQTTNSGAAAYIASIDPFTANSMSGDGPRYNGGAAWSDEVRKFYNSMRENIDYVVYSYATPIAWHTFGGQWFIPDAKYSVTTSRHQNIVRRAVKNYQTLTD